MADCRACGAPIHWATVDESQERVPLENYATTSGPDRYRIKQYGQPTIVIAVGEDFHDEAFADHRTTCTRLTARPA